MFNCQMATINEYYAIKETNMFDCDEKHTPVSLKLAKNLQ